MKYQPLDYGPGFFTSLMRENRWPPGFQSQLDPSPGEVKRREAAVRGRATQLANGHTGSMKNGLSKKSAKALPSIGKAEMAQVNQARAKALDAGQPRYWNESPCHAGHVGWRYTRNYACCECMAAAARKTAGVDIDSVHQKAVAA